MLRLHHSLSFLFSFLLAVALAHGAIAKGFLTGETYPTGEYPVAAVVQDFNDDGIADIATANLNDENVSVLLGNANGSFGTANTFPVGAAAVELASADLNGDGNADLAVTDGIKSVYIVLGNSDGTFGAPSSISLHNNPIGIEIADLNGDSKLDLAIAIFGPDNNSQGEVSILLGNGDGSFAAPVFYSLGHNGNRLTAVDLNGDGKLDLAVAVEHFSTERNSLAVLLGTGDGTFQPATTSVSGSATDVAAGDLNGDGRIDLALAGHFDNTVRIVLGNGDGTFQPATNYATSGAAETVVLGDLNRDGVLDILVGGGHADVLLGNGDGTFGEAVAWGVGNRFAAIGYFNRDPAADIVAGGGFSSIGVAFGNGDGTFRAPLVYSPGASIYGLASADFDGDGHADLVLGGGPFALLGNRTLVILLGDGGGGFIQGASFSNMQPHFVRTGDFNGDTKPDILMTSYNFTGVFVFLGNGDGTFQAAKTTALLELNLWPELGDFDNDGRLDVAIAHVFADKLTIFLGNGDGTFYSAGDYATDDTPQSPVSSDFNNDGNLDLAVSNTALAGSVGVYLGNGDGTFQSALTMAASNPIYLDAADFNRDGNSDLVLAGDGLKVFQGNGDGTFQEPQTALSEYGPVHTSDVNGDGKIDVVVSADFEKLTVLPGKGDGTFRPPRDFATGSQFTGDFVLTDLNGDGFPEAIVNDLSDAVSVLLNTTKPRQQPLIWRH